MAREPVNWTRQGVQEAIRESFSQCSIRSLSTANSILDCASVRRLPSDRAFEYEISGRKGLRVRTFAYPVPVVDVVSPAVMPAASAATPVSPVVMPAASATTPVPSMVSPAVCSLRDNTSARHSLHGSDDSSLQYSISAWLVFPGSWWVPTWK